MTRPKVKGTAEQRWAAKVTDKLGSVQFIAIYMVVTLTWVLLNCLGIVTLDPHPFALMSTVINLYSGLTASIVLLGNDLAERRRDALLNHMHGMVERLEQLESKKQNNAP